MKRTSNAVRPDGKALGRWLKGNGDRAMALSPAERDLALERLLFDATTRVPVRARFEPMLFNCLKASGTGSHNCE